MAATFFVLSEHEPKKRKMPVPMIFRDRTNPLEGFSDTELISRYRFPRHGILELLDLIEKDVSRPTGRSYAIPAVSQVNRKIKVNLDPDTKQEIYAQNIHWGLDLDLRNFLS